MISILPGFWSRFLNQVSQVISRWTKPATTALIIGTATDLTRSRTDLLIENALLRQQLIVLNRQVERPHFTPGDRWRLVLLARLTRFWDQALLLVQPETLLRWHRELFRLYWRHKSSRQKQERRLSPETIALIRQLARENRLWGAERIRGELLKLGITISKRTIQKYLNRLSRSPAGQQTWGTFLNNHAKEIWACDFTVAYDLFFRPIYIFVVIEHYSRRIIHLAVTRSASDVWVTQQLREATPWGHRPKYLIRDRDNKFGQLFAQLARHSGIKVIQTPIKSPRANAICERFIGSLRRECLDHTFILNTAQLRRVGQEYVAYYNPSRPHQGIHQQIPAIIDQPVSPSSTGRIIVRPVLGGLHH